MTALHSPVVGSRGARAPELVDDGPALLRRQLARIAPARAGKAVDAGQVAGVRQLPRQADGSVEALGEALDEPHGPTRSTIIPVPASVPRARVMAGRSAGGTPTAAQASSADPWSPRA